MNPKAIPITAAVLLLLGIPPMWPYGYYVLLRWAISLSSAYLAYRENVIGRTSWLYAFATIMVIFNPLVPFYLSKNFWSVIDFAAASIFLYYVLGTEASYKRENVK